MTMRLLLLPDDDAGDAEELLLDGEGAIRARRTVRAGEPAASPPVPATVVVPGTLVRALWLVLPSRQPAQALAAARLALEDHVAGDPATMHLAIAQPADPAQPRMVLVVPHVAMQAWHAQCARFGIVADAMLPDYLLLRSPDDDGVHVAHWRGQLLVRGAALAFRAEAGLAGAIAGDRPRRAIDGDVPTEAVFARQAAQAAPDLLQGPYARRDRRAARRRRRLLLWAALALASPALVDGGIALRHALSAQWLHARAERLLAVQDPQWAARGGDVAGAALALVSRTTWPDTLAAHLDRLAMAVAQSPGTSLDALTLERDGRVQAGLRHGDAASLDAVRSRLGDAGLDAVVLDTQPLGDAWRSELSVEVRR
jgi:general secretion pathway protein L